MDEQVLIMECCKGNMQDLIDTNPNGLTSDEFIKFCQNLVDAIQHMHNKNVIHRDVKPTNILLMHHNGQTIYKLADFGAARFLGDNETYGSLYGTFEYVHPDIFAKFYAKALDISYPKQTFNDYHELWSVGVTIFEVASGRLPFNPKKGRADHKQMYRMMKQKQTDCISAEETECGINWSRELPENCHLDESVKQVITPLLAGLLQPTNEWSFQHFFEEAKRILYHESTLPIENEQNHAQQPNWSHKFRMHPRARRHRPNRARHMGEIQWWRPKQYRKRLLR
ncbi:serine/threonine-protein kinase TBK1-like [Sitodiplosis mosellana]|uniref:serine/threonine-protein kinase TBK1-like n=1 Tax=Sitodiplosis mosellana TaxID=263140 RepID=UPI002443F765|nr:serine/threonine-protein kinase TBK1-like [Sitodiplosis mosellana]